MAVPTLHVSLSIFTVPIGVSVSVGVCVSGRGNREQTEASTGVSVLSIDGW